jgi:hypothetical protein
MSINTVTLLPYTEHGVPSGNYDGSSEDFIGDPQKAANYYRGRGGLQTVVFRIQDFIGSITIEATLDADPTSTDWFTTFEYGSDSTSGDGSTSDVFPTNILGNFTWLRARVSNFITGTIESVTASY